MAIQHGNRGIVKNNLLLYYNRESSKCFKGQSSTNLLTRTTTFDSAVWDGYCGNRATNVTPNTKEVVDVFGTYNAVKVVRNGNNGCGGAGTVAMGLLYYGPAFLVAGQTYTMSFYAKSKVAGTLLRGGLNDVHYTGYVTLTTSWVRYSFTFTNITDTTRGFQFISDQSIAGETYYLCYPQVEQNSYATPYSDIADNINVRNVTTTNLLTSTYSSLYTNWGVDGSGQGTIGLYSYIENNTAVRITDVNSNTRFVVNNIAGFSASTTYTFSVKYRKVSGTPTLRFQIQWFNASSVQVGSVSFPTTSQINIFDIDGWQLAKFTVTSPAGAARMTWFIQDGDDYTGYTHSYDLKEPQIQTGVAATSWTPSSVTANTLTSGGGLYDLSGNNINANLSNMAFTGSGYYFDGNSTYIDTGYSILNLDPSQGFSMEAVVNFDALKSYSPESFTITSVDTVNNIITVNTTHNLIVGDRIRFRVSSGGSLPSPLQDQDMVAPYYVLNPTSNTFQVTTGGGAVDLTTAGSGTTTVSIPSRNGMLFGRTSYGGVGIYYYINPTNVISIFGFLRNTIGSYGTPVITINAGVTYLVTIVYDAINNSQYSIYINGEFRGSQSVQPSSVYGNGVTGNFFVGLGGQVDGGGTSVYAPFKGSCPMQRIYRRTLTSSEVMQNYIAIRKTYGI